MPENTSKCLTRSPSTGNGGLKMKLRPIDVILVCIMMFFVSSSAAACADCIVYKDLRVPDRSGKVMTVLGLIDAKDVGDATMHEHLFIDYWLPLDQPERWRRLGIKRPVSDEELEIWRKKVTIENRPMMMEHLLRTRDAFRLTEVDDAVATARRFKELGGATIVDVTTIGLNRQPEKLVKVAEKTGVNIVMGAGYYRWPWHPETLPDLSIDDLTYQIVSDIVDGVDGTGVCAGIIGEIPVEHIILDPEESDEVRVLRAAISANPG